MTDERPKDYSRVYYEDSTSNESLRLMTNYDLQICTTDSNNNNNNNSGNNFLNIGHPKPPLPPSRFKNPHQNLKLQQNQLLSNNQKCLDGTIEAPKHREVSIIDLRKVVSRLENLPKENHRFYAMDTLNKHYSSVFTNRRKTSRPIGGYRAYIKYHDDQDTYVVRVGHNTLRAVVEKLPKRGNYRYFFKKLDDTCEEVEFDESSVPFYQKDGQKQIYCHIFPLSN